MSTRARSLAVLALASIALLMGCADPSTSPVDTPTATSGAPASATSVTPPPAAGPAATPSTAPNTTPSASAPTATPSAPATVPSGAAPTATAPAARGPARSPAPEPARPAAPQPVAPQPVASVEPQPATSTGPPALAALTLSPRALGTLVVGRPVPNPKAPTSMVRWDPDYCAEFPHPGGVTGAFVAAYPDSVSPSLGERAPFTLMSAEGHPRGAVVGVLVMGPEIRTAEGIHVGSSRADLTAAYPAFSATRSDQLSDVFVIDGATGRLMFEVAKAVAAPLEGYWEEPVVDTVLWMRLTPPDAPVHAIAGSDAGGPCAI